MSASIAALKANIERVTGKIPPKMCKKVKAQNWLFRMGYLNRNDDQHLHEVIFKK